MNKIENRKKEKIEMIFCHHCHCSTSKCRTTEKRKREKKAFSFEFILHFVRFLSFSINFYAKIDCFVTSSFPIVFRSSFLLFSFLAAWCFPLLLTCL